MAKNRRRRNKKWYHRQRSNQDDSDSNNLSEVDLILVKKFLSDYRSLAYDARTRRNNGILQLESKALVIGEHNFPTLTDELCSQPYIDLPETLSSKDRRKIHALCCQSLDLYHAGIGPKSKRRLVVSIYADGFRFIPEEDLESSVCSYKGAYAFPYSMCKPWYYLDNDTTAERLSAIEDEKKLIQQIVQYPEKSLTYNNGGDLNGFLNLADMESLDLSAVPSVEDTTYELIDTVAKLKTCVNELRYGVGDNDTNKDATRLSELAFDMEMHNQGSAVRTCLIQITANTVQKDYIIDPLAAGVWDAIPNHLGPLFSDPNILKIGHGIGGMDCSSLHRDFGILVVNAFDTCEASSIARRSKGGMNLAALCKHYGLQTWEHYRDLKDRFQTTNWCKRPLSEEALEYGRYDVRYLITLRRLLMRDLIKMDMINGTSGFDKVSSYDSTSMSDSTEKLVSSSSHWSSISESSSIANGGNSMERGNIRMPMEAIISVSDLPSFEKLMKAVSISQKRCLKVWARKEEGENESILRNQSFISMIKQSANKENQSDKCSWTDNNTKLYTQLADWRTTVAEREAIDVNDVCSLDLLCWVSYKLPSNRSELRRYEYILPAPIEDKNLPYFDEMTNIISEMNMTQVTAEAVFYSIREKVKEGIGKKERKVFIATAVLCVVALILTKRKR